jgi:hypothetical protein
MKLARGAPLDSYNSLAFDSCDRLHFSSEEGWGFFFFIL